MQVVAFASQKGGSGKTTLTGHMAVQAERAGDGPVALVDTDPQGSLADWWNEREAETPLFAHTSIARLGIGIKTQVPSVFNGLSVRDNLWIAAARHKKGKAIGEAVEAQIDKLSLGRFADSIAGQLAQAKAA